MEESISERLYRHLKVYQDYVKTNYPDIDDKATLYMYGYIKGFDHCERLEKDKKGIKE